MKIYPRSAWTSREPKGRVALDWKKVVHIVDHWPGSKGNLDPSKTAAYLRGWQAYHMDVRGWTDIAYNEAIDQNGDVWICRGDYKDGATSGWGGKSYSILLVLGTLDTPSPEMLASLDVRNEYQRQRAAVTCTVVGHRDLVKTDCPGDKIYAWLNKPPTTTTFPLPAGYYFGPKEGPKESVSGYYNTLPNGKKGHPGLLQAQGRLKALGYLKGNPDGLYGPDTEQATKKVQTLTKLAVDGLIGKDTWDALFGVVPEPPTTTTAAQTNWLDPRFGGSKDYATRAKYMKNSIKADVYMLQETNEAMRNEMRSTLGGWKVYVAPGNSVCVMFPGDSKYEKLGDASHGTNYHGAVAVRVNGLPYVSTHTRPRASFSSDAAAKKGKADDVRRAFKLVAKEAKALVAGDFNMNADAIAKEYGFTRLTPKVDTMPKVDGDQYFDAIYGKGITGEGSVFTPPLTDHKGTKVVF